MFLTFSQRSGEVADEVVEDFYEFVVDKQTANYRNSGGNHLKLNQVAEPSTRKKAWANLVRQWPVVADSPDEPSYQTIIPAYRLLKVGG